MDNGKFVIASVKENNGKCLTLAFVDGSGQGWNVFVNYTTLE